MRSKQHIKTSYIYAASSTTPLSASSKTVSCCQSLFLMESPWELNRIFASTLSSKLICMEDTDMTLLCLKMKPWFNKSQKQGRTRRTSLRQWTLIFLLFFLLVISSEIPVAQISTAFWNITFHFLRRVEDVMQTSCLSSLSVQCV